jgi:hypothetical protein
VLGATPSDLTSLGDLEAVVRLQGHAAITVRVPPYETSATPRLVMPHRHSSGGGRRRKPVADVAVEDDDSVVSSFLARMQQRTGTDDS